MQHNIPFKGLRDLYKYKSSKWLLKQVAINLGLDSVKDVEISKKEYKN